VIHRKAMLPDRQGPIEMPNYGDVVLVRGVDDAVSACHASCVAFAAGKWSWNQPLMLLLSAALQQVKEVGAFQAQHGFGLRQNGIPLERHSLIRCVMPRSAA